MKIYLIITIVLQALSALAAILIIGEPRKPISRVGASLSVAAAVINVYFLYQIYQAL